MSKIVFDVYLDNPAVVPYWPDKKVLELEYEVPENENAPTADAIVMEAIDYVESLPKNVEEHIILQELFDRWIQESSKFSVKFNIRKSKSK